MVIRAESLRIFNKTLVPCRPAPTISRKYWKIFADKHSEHRVQLTCRGQSWSCQRAHRTKVQYVFVGTAIIFLLLAVSLCSIWGTVKRQDSFIQSIDSRLRHRYRHLVPLVALAFLVLPTQAHASLLHGETLDTVANVIAWFAFIIVPPVLVVAFLMVHILPEKIAHKRGHPQLGAIKCLCLLSLVFGGLLWPIAWLWAYSKPVLHKVAYGTDVDDSHEKPVGKTSAISELEQLRARVAELEAQVKGG